MKLSWLTPEEFIVWYLIDEKFRKLHGPLVMDINWKRFNWRKMFRYAERNFVLYQLCKKICRTKIDYIDEVIRKRSCLIMKQGNYELQKMRMTLATIKTLWDGKVNYYIIKTRTDTPSYDVDVLFESKKEYELAISIARNNGYKFIREEPFKGWIDINNGIKIELHHGISWFGMKALDTEFITAKPKKVKLMDLEFQTINEEAEFVLGIAHQVLDVQPTGLGGFSKLVSALEARRWERVISQAEKHNWVDQLTYYLSVIGKLCEYIYFYRPSLPVEPVNVKVRPRFPFWIPLYKKVFFMMKKVISDNEGIMSKLNMLQLSLRRYLWGRLNDLVS